MSKLVLSGDTSGSVTLDAPAVSGTTTLTLPTTTGTLVVTSGAQTIEFADGSSSAPSITNSGDTNTGIFFPAADTIAFADGGVEAMRLDSSGNVGIGTSSPNYKLTFGGQTGATATPLALRFSSDYSNGTTAASSKIFLYNDGSTGQIYGIGVGSSADVQYHAGGTGASSGNHRWYTNDTERMRITSTGLLQFNSGYGSVATAYGCRAWVNFNGTGTVAIRASGNVTSITDGGVGIYSLNLTTSMPDANYSTIITAGSNSANSFESNVNPSSTTSTVNINTHDYGNSYSDNSLICVAVFR